MNLREPDTAQPVIDYSMLESRFTSLRDEYEHADPFPHIVIDNFFSEELARRAAAAFPPFANKRMAQLLEARAYGGGLDADPVFREMFDALHGPEFTRWLERVTGIPTLVGDTELVGAGLHQGARGSFLHLHADHNTHPRDDSRYRRVNVLVYMNRVWEAGWNGDLQLWDRDGATCRKTVTPAFNRCVIMEVNDEAFHGYGRLRIPPGETRKLLAAYYYADHPGRRQSQAPHGTILRHPRNESVLSRFDHALRRAVLWRLERPKN